ncbi:E3 ubiquitin-protein ligase FANCL [Hylaeus anthracinus]|uniref:E3 ubiquitin-protein ligase FANCL n=1 Tax=Hylaeus anthracinus TaxID=313031 RepID=UPI0023B8A682|nr:E3 ubiquitin-protein ligase FANCL [Hylaeus anthracinus]
MVVDEYEIIVQSYPEMILISESPVTWQGFLTVSCRSNSGRNTRVKLKLIVPNYPSLHDADINFGKEITLIRNIEFSQKVKNLMENITKVSSFLRQLQSLISSFMNIARLEDDTYEVTDNEAVEVMQELKDALKAPPGVKLLSDSNLNTIQLSLKNVSLKLQRTKHRPNPWKVIYSDLPEISAFGPFERNLSTLIIAKNKFKLQVEILENTWSNLRLIDEKCWVLDPLKPTFSHLYRRIYLTPSLSMFIQVDPLNPMDLPEIKFMGTDIEIKLQMDLLSKNIHYWSPKRNIVDNLMMLLHIDTFPPKKEKVCIEDKNAIVTDEECCICFSMKLDDETLPDKICSNPQCRRHFHTPCLLQWLQAVASNHIVFGHIHGACPHCQESISCCINS